MVSGQIHLTNFIDGQGSVKQRFWGNVQTTWPTHGVQRDMRLSEQRLTRQEPEVPFVQIRAGIKPPAVSGAEPQLQLKVGLRPHTNNSLHGLLAFSGTVRWRKKQLAIGTWRECASNCVAHHQNTLHATHADRKNHDI